ncbi:AAA family ATPase [Ruania halotolerans]|uniref:AAA family ATPase n=1 Tax=Ruania halotolerans TaxID=2897773 RepID=UPI001E34744D|nr:AAA family ATPase [Ruania halotolerans]UFU06304.1 AAA family ATPase [Ruania halotolerans]
MGPFYPAWDGDRFDHLLDQLLVPKRERVGDLSRGEGIKLSLATALAQQPELLILDEPSSGLDPASRRQIADLIRDFMVDPSHAVLFSTHITTDLENLADEIMVLVAGEVAHHGPLIDLPEQFAMARGSGTPPSGPLIGLQAARAQWSAMIRLQDSAAFGPEVVIDAASIDDVVVHLAAEEKVVAA